MLTLLGVSLNNIISKGLHMFIIVVDTLLESYVGDDKKCLYFYGSIFIKYYRGPLEKIPIYSFLVSLDKSFLMKPVESSIRQKYQILINGENVPVQNEDANMLHNPVNYIENFVDPRLYTHANPE